MEEIDSGGRAFPWCGDLNESPHIQLGMSMRDWYAGMALQGMLARPNSSPSGHPKTQKGYSAAAFEFADAMLKARSAA